MMPHLDLELSLLADKPLTYNLSVEDLAKFIRYLQQNPSGGVFRDALVAKDYSVNVSPDFYGELTSEERELIPIYNALTPAERETLATDVSRELGRSLGE